MPNDAGIAQAVAVDLEQAARFLDVIAPGEPLTFQTFDDRKGAEKDKTLSRILHGTLEQHADSLVSLNNQGAGVFFMVNPGDGKGRAKANVIGVRAAVVDDDRGAALAPIQKCDLPPHVVVETSPEHHHAYWLLADCPLEQFTPLQKALARHFGGDESVNDLPRVMRLPGFMHRKALPFRSRIISTEPLLRPYPVSELLKRVTLSPPAPPATGGIPDGERNVTLTKFAGRMRRDGADRDEIEAALLARNQKCSTPLSDDEVRAIATSIMRYPPKAPRSSKVALHDGDQDALLEVTQDSVATIFVERFKDTFRYAHDRGAWYVWFTTHWKYEPTKLAFDYTRKLSRTLNAESRQAIARAAWCDGVERFAQADRAIAMRGDEWDFDPWLLNTPAGTVELKTGNIRPHDQKDLITKITSVAPSNKKPVLWLEFLNQATQGDETLIEFLQRISGYALTGDTREECLFYVYGPGGNGKGVFATTIYNVLGEFAANATMDMFMASKQERHTTDLAMLRGARFVTASEIAEGRAWDEQRVKALTGNDPITARFMRCDNFTYRPTFKLILLGNHKPVLRTVDDAWRRRFHIIPFTFTPPTKDLQLKAKLEQEYPAILNWMIEGCLKWQADGLKVPQRVLDETAEYFAAQDTFGDWLATHCETKVSFMDTSRRLFASWKAYAEQAGEFVGSGKDLAARLQRGGFERLDHVPLVGGRGFKGLRVRDE